MTAICSRAPQAVPSPSHWGAWPHSRFGEARLRASATRHWLRVTDFVPLSDAHLRKALLAEAEKVPGPEVNLKTINGKRAGEDRRGHSDQRRPGHAQRLQHLDTSPGHMSRAHVPGTSLCRGPGPKTGGQTLGTRRQTACQSVAYPTELKATHLAPICHASPPHRCGFCGWVLPVPVGIVITKMTKPKKPKTVDTLERHDCRWPIGDPRHPDFHFCGAAQLQGRPYCAFHWRMAFQPTRSRQIPVTDARSRLCAA